MSLGRAVNDALNALPVGGDPQADGTVHAEADGATADVDVVEVDKLGVRLRNLRVRRADPYDLAEEAKELPDRMRSLPERIEPVEVDPGLGGAILRTAPDEITDDEFFELGLDGRDLDLKRVKGGPGQDREPVDWTMTRRQLEKLIDEME